MAPPGRIGSLVFRIASCVSACLLAAPLYANPGSDLEWELAGEEAMSWEDASASCVTLEAGGHQDWRLPSAEELTLQQSTMPPELASSLASREIDIWACNVSNQRPAAAESGQIERLMLEELELERELCELAEGTECGPADSSVPGPARWQFRFSIGRPN